MCLARAPRRSDLESAETRLGLLARLVPTGGSGAVRPTSTVLLGDRGGDQEVGLGQGREGDVAVPGVVAADLVLVEPDLVLRGLEALLDGPSAAGDADDHSRNVLCIDEGVEVLRASKVGNMNDVIADLRDFAAHFLSRSQVKLDNFPSATLKKTDDRSVRLQSGLFLSKRAATRDRRYNSYEKKRILFHDCSFCGITRRFARK